MNVTVELVNASGDRSVPTRKDFQHWSNAAVARLLPAAGDLELSIRLVGEAESAFLNSTYRRCGGPTNILSFPPPAQGLPEGASLLGDLALCVPVIKREAREQRKTQKAHWAHLTVHGVLHLQGYDHDNQAQAARMEGLEVAILKELGFADPYEPL